MRRVLDFVKDNKKIVIVIVLIVVLIAIIYFIKRSDSDSLETYAVAEKSATEAKLTTILSSIDGVGETDVMINESDGTIKGVIIVCEGADRIMVRNDILNAVATALNVDRSLIAVYAMKT